MSVQQLAGIQHTPYSPLPAGIVPKPLRFHACSVRYEPIRHIAPPTQAFVLLDLLQTYEDVKSLRYGHLMIMTDQDHDGSHIKGLIMNFLHTFYPTLLKMPGFLLEFITPIVKVGTFD